MSTKEHTNARKHRPVYCDVASTPETHTKRAEYRVWRKSRIAMPHPHHPEWGMRKLQPRGLPKPCKATLAQRRRRAIEDRIGVNEARRDHAWPDPIQKPEE